MCWKRAELANTYMKDFNNNPELVFAGRCLDWQGGKLIVPESLRPYLPDGEKIIEHLIGKYTTQSPSVRFCSLARWTTILAYECHQNIAGQCFFQVVALPELSKLLLPSRHRKQNTQS